MCWTTRLKSINSPEKKHDYHKKIFSQIRNLFHTVDTYSYDNIYAYILMCFNNRMIFIPYWMPKLAVKVRRWLFSLLLLSIKGKPDFARLDPCTLPRSLATLGSSSFSGLVKRNTNEEDCERDWWMRPKVDFRRKKLIIGLPTQNANFFTYCSGH